MNRRSVDAGVEPAGAEAIATIFGRRRSRLGIRRVSRTPLRGCGRIGPSRGPRGARQARSDAARRSASWTAAGGRAARDVCRGWPGSAWGGQTPTARRPATDGPLTVLPRLALGQRSWREGVCGFIGPAAERIDARSRGCGNCPAQWGVTRQGGGPAGPPNSLIQLDRCAGPDGSPGAQAGRPERLAPGPAASAGCALAGRLLPSRTPAAWRSSADLAGLGYGSKPGARSHGCARRRPPVSSPARPEAARR